ncbi:hypothetical protein CR513_02253, partial [Mucuna pruriens]
MPRSPSENQTVIAKFSNLDTFGAWEISNHHDKTGKKEHAIYYLRKKFTDYEMRYFPLERTCCALAWATQWLRHYMLSHTTWLVSKLDPIKYIFKKPTLTGWIAH